MYGCEHLNALESHPNLNYRQHLSAVLHDLPSFEHVSSLPTLEEQARSVIEWIGRRALTLEYSTKVLPDSLTCPNCGTRFCAPRSPYCSEACKDQAAFVRQFRAGIDTRTMDEPDRQVALGQKLWRILGGGLPLRVSLIPDKAFAKLLARNGGKCEHCGLPAKHVDHIGTG